MEILLEPTSNMLLILRFEQEKPFQGDSLNLPGSQESFYTIKRETEVSRDSETYSAHNSSFQSQSSNVKIVDSNLPHHRRASKSNKESSIGEIVRLIITYVKQECNKYEHVGQEYKLIEGSKAQDNRYPNVPTTSWRIFIRSMESFQGLTLKSPPSWHRSLALKSWALLEDLALYDNESRNEPRDFAKPVKAIALPQDVLSTSDRLLIKLENQVQCLMEAHLAPTQPTQVNKITTSCEICSGPHDTQYCMEDPETTFLNTHCILCVLTKVGGLVSEFMASQDARLSKFEADFKYNDSDITNKHQHTELKAITNQIVGTLPSDMVKNPKLRTHPVLSARQDDEGSLGNINSNPHLQPDPLASIATEQDDGEVLLTEIIRDDEPQCEDPKEGEGATTEGPPVEYFDTFPTRDELTYHRKPTLGRMQMEELSNVHGKEDKGDEKEQHQKSVYLRNEEEQEKRGKLYLMRRSLEDLRMLSLDDSWRTI
ncbi:hypothetical protein Tco_0798811 [Tanacetum coccineum]